MSNLNIAKNKQLNTNNDVVEATESFYQHIIQKNTTATNNFNTAKFDMNKAKQKSRDALTALGADDALQAMLAAQILSIHELQQLATTYALAADDYEFKKYYTNATVKLANCFVQQASMLACKTARYWVAKNNCRKSGSSSRRPSCSW